MTGQTSVQRKDDSLHADREARSKSVLRVISVRGKPHFPMKNITAVTESELQSDMKC